MESLVPRHGRLCMAEVVQLRRSKVDGMKVFPLPADAKYRYAQRYGPTTGHWGVDLMADRGTPVLAVADGRVVSENDTKGGKVVYLSAQDGQRYYFAHLDVWTGEFPRDVRAGDQIGTVGNTGNAKGGPPHLHFQVSPSKGKTVDPYPLLKSIDPHNLGTAPLPDTLDHQEITKPSVQAGGGWGWLLLLLLWSRRGRF